MPDHLDRDLMAGRRKKTNRHGRSFLSNIAVFCGFILCATGFLLALIICVDRVSEFMNGMNYRNNWSPVAGAPLEVIKAIPLNLYICITKFLESLLASLIFFPLLVLIVPLYDLFYSGDASILLYGYLPFAVGAGLVFAAIAAGEQKPGKPKR